MTYAVMIPIVIPTKIEPKKIANKLERAFQNTPSPDSPRRERVVLYEMIAIASFRIDSPNINAKRFLSQFSSLKIESTATGSVELINDPNAKLPANPRFVDNPIHPTKKRSNEVDKIAIDVPMNAKPKMLPKFLKKYFLSILMADS